MKAIAFCFCSCCTVVLIKSFIENYVSLSGAGKKKKKLGECLLFGKHYLFSDSKKKAGDWLALGKFKKIKIKKTSDYF